MLFHPTLSLKFTICRRLLNVSWIGRRDLSQHWGKGELRFVYLCGPMNTLLGSCTTSESDFHVAWSSKCINCGGVGLGGVSRVMGLDESTSLWGWSWVGAWILCVLKCRFKLYNFHNHSLTRLFSSAHPLIISFSNPLDDSGGHDIFSIVTSCEDMLMNWGTIRNWGWNCIHLLYIGQTLHFDVVKCRCHIGKLMNVSHCQTYMVEHRYFKTYFYING